MACFAVVRCGRNVFNQVSLCVSTCPGSILNTTAVSLKTKTWGPFSSLQQICHKHQRIRFKEQKESKEKVYTFQKKKSSFKQIKEKIHSPEFLARKPIDNIWIRRYYPQQSCLLESAILKHKEYADPMMLNNEAGLIYADMQLNMKTKKKTKFLPNLKSLIVYPHLFNAGPTPRCLVLSHQTDDIDKALAAGATFAGGSDLLLQLKTEAITRSMYDHVLCTPDIYSELMPLRPVFKDKFPHQKRGNVGKDVEELLDYFQKGVTYESKKIQEDIAILQVPFGQLNMEEEVLVENFQKLIEKLCQGRNEKLGPFITKIDIIAPPSPEKFLLSAERYVPGYDFVLEQEEEEEELSEELLEDENRQEAKNRLKS